MGWGEPIAGPGGAESELRFPSVVFLHRFLSAIFCE